ncbi:hypothetical protein [Ammoniphilus sp. CFH 90114]|uniref:hypothetical protein n=1 Tax=Ammoniphilus sp. CFH 90114 TaxID=2493665 RepID=UPI00100FC62D|nr:hypothetical protein [Ammoniphilus sp. CFH 90114]
MEYKEEIWSGHGIFHLAKKDGQTKTILLNCEINTDIFEGFRVEFLDESANQEESYLVSYKDKVFTTHFGNPPVYFHLSFQERKEQLRLKYGYDESE